MASNTQSVASPAPSNVHHLHIEGGVCPVCDQPIPHERADEVARRLKMREQLQTEQLTARLTETFARDKTKALEALRLEGEQKVDEVRAQTRIAVEASFKTEVAQAVAARDEAQAVAAAKTQEAETARTAAAAELAVVRGALDQAQRDSAAALKDKELEATQREEAARQAATAAAAILLEAATAERDAALSSSNALKADMELLQQANEAALADAETKSAEREAKAREEATAAANSVAHEQVSAANQAQLAAEARATAAEGAAANLQQTHEAELNARLSEQREALEKSQTDAVNAEKAAAFEDRLKLANKVEELQRALEKKTNEELGEGAEIDLFEELKKEFDGDKIVRIVKGTPGADIRHTVIHNGLECGTILYDSKNHSAWRNDFVAKLKADQLADRADHAVLSTSKFPAGCRQVAVQNGVVIAGPARIVAIVQMIRTHIVQAHTLRMSNEARSQKTDALYSYITSQQCADAFRRLDEHAEALLDIQEKEKKAHDNVWKQQGIAIRNSMKVQAEMRLQIDTILGTASSPESA